MFSSFSFFPPSCSCWPLFLCLVWLINQINILSKLFQHRMQNRPWTTNVTWKLKNNSLEAVNQRSQLMFVLCWRILQQFFAPSHQLGPKYHLVLVDHTLWWTKIITICISMLHNRKKIPVRWGKKSNTTKTIHYFYKGLTPSFAKTDGSVHYIKLTHGDLRHHYSLRKKIKPRIAQTRCQYMCWVLQI